MGRFPTCSSPVRHVVPRRGHVRLACIRHAASVNPEPGSNSPPKLLPVLPKKRQDFCFTLCVRHPRCAPLPNRPNRNAWVAGRVGPPSSAAHSGPATLPTDHPDRFRSPGLVVVPGLATNLSRCCAVISARDKRKPPCFGRAALGLERICVSAPIVSDDLQSDTLRSLARALRRVSALADGGRL